MTRYRGLVIFDLDGTLFRTETASVPAVHQAFLDFGLSSPDLSSILDCFGRTTEEFHRWISARCSVDLSNSLIARVDQLELEYISDRGKLYPEVHPALDRIQASGYRLAICSNGYDAYVQRVVEAHGLFDRFDLIRWRRSSDGTKSVMVREVLMRLDTHPALVVGDRRDDVEAAHANDLPAVAAGYGYGRAEELVEAEAIAASPAELPCVICSLLG